MKTPMTLLVILMFFSTSASAWDEELPWLFERKIIGENNLTPVEDAAGTNAYVYALAIARVENKGDGSPFCTGSRVGKNLFLTNFHCDYDCDTMQFTMGVEKDRPESKRATFICKKLINKTEEFDYALYQVEPLSGTPEHEYPILTLSNAGLHLNQSLIVASHPSGRLKEIDRSEECLIAQTETFLTESGRTTIKHMCDTEGGSSGSPVLDRTTGHAVALHWGGRNNQFNMAIPMSLVLKNMKESIPADVYSQLNIAGAAE